MADPVLLETPQAFPIEEALFPGPDLANRSTFSVDSLEKADWTARKILEAQERMDVRKALADTYRRRIERWLEEANRDDERSIEFFSSILQPFAEQETQQGKGRTVRLLAATVSLRRLPERVEITDAEKALRYCEAHHPEAVVVRKELSKSELKRLYASGIAIPGILLDGGCDRLYVKRQVA